MTGPSQVPGPTVAPSAWASVRLIQGASKANQWQIDSSTNRAQLTVGADKACDWSVAAGGVAAIHFELFWDGRRLWIADTHEAGGVTVDGSRLASWQPITGRARIEFGTAVMVAECSVPAVSVEQRPNMSSPMPAESIDLEPTRRPGQGGVHHGDDDERTTLHVRHDSHPAAGKGHDDKVPLHAAPTTISEMPEGAHAFGGPPAMPPGSGMSPPSVLQARKPVVAVPTIISEPGRGLPPPGMLQMPNPPARPGGALGMGMSTPDPGMRPGMPPGMGMGMPTPDPAAAMRPGPGMMAPHMQNPMAGNPMMPHPMAQPMMTPTGRPAWMDRLGLPKTSLPARTWALVIVTVAALMIVMFMGGNDKAAPRRRVAKKPAAAAPAQPAPTPATPQPGAGSETQPSAAGDNTTGGEAKTAEAKTGQAKTGEAKTAEAKTGEAKTAEAKTAEAKTAEAKTGEAKTAEAKTGQAKTGQAKTAEAKTSETAPPAEAGAGSSATPAQGADLLLAGRQREAMAVYDELARRYPEQREYAAILKILKRRLAERCKDKQPGDSPCPPSAQ